MPTVVREAQFLIALAAEEFLKRYSESLYNLASRDRRTTVQYKDNGVSLNLGTCVKCQYDLDDCSSATLVRKADEFLFLEGLFVKPHSQTWTESSLQR